MSHDAAAEGLPCAPLLTASERSELLRLARTSIGAALGLAEPPELLLQTANLLEPCGAFVTLQVDGALRGCIGAFQPEVERSLHETIVRTARAAAFEDPRFPPLTSVEWHRIHIEISRLSRPRRSTAAQIVVGMHGVHVARGPARALLLPQVASRYAWSAERLLREVCRKAGLAADAWQESETEISVFTAEVFGAEPPIDALVVDTRLSRA